MKFIQLILPVLLVLALGCQETPKPQDAETIAIYQEYLDTLNAQYVESVEAPVVVEPEPQKPQRIDPNSSYMDTHGEEIPDLSTEVEKKDLSERGITLNLEVDSVQTPSVDTLNQILGVTDLIFVWQGDTCTTNKLTNFLAIYWDNDTYCLQDTPDEIKGHLVGIMVTNMLTGHLTQGVNEANSYLSTLLMGTGLTEYIIYANEHE